MISEWSKRQAPSLAEFEAIADAAFARLPSRFRDLCKDVVIRIEDFPTDEVLDGPRSAVWSPWESFIPVSAAARKSRPRLPRRPMRRTGPRAPSIPGPAVG